MGGKKKGGANKQTNETPKQVPNPAQPGGNQRQE